MPTKFILGCHPWGAMGGHEPSRHIFIRSRFVHSRWRSIQSARRLLPIATAVSYDGRAEAEEEAGRTTSMHPPKPPVAPPVGHYYNSYKASSSRCIANSHVKQNCTFQSVRETRGGRTEDAAASESRQSCPRWTSLQD
eukprot:scaffold133984_cov29-Tisochrysis_lutea.AAC.4